MKALKLILIALVVAAVIGGLLLLTGKSSSQSGGGRDNDLYNRLESELSEEWEQASDWNRQLFDQSLSTLNHNRRDLGSGYQTLADMVSEYALDHLYNSTMAQYRRSDCTPAQAEQFNADLNHFLSKTQGFAGSEKVTTMQGTYKLYIDILALVDDSKKSVAAAFNFDSDTWTDFRSYEQRQLKRRDNCTGNIYYNYVSNIDDVRNGLSQVPANLAAAKSRFKDDLAGRIIRAYDGHEKTADLYDRLSYLSSSFTEQFGRNDRLTTYVRSYRDAVGL